MESGSLKYIPEPPVEPLLPAPRSPFKISKKNTILIGVLAFIILVLIYVELISAPSGLLPETIVSVPKGQGLSGAAQSLVENKVVRSPFAFKSLVVLFSGSSHGLRAGDYYFKEPENVLVVAWRLTHSMYELENVKVTIPEGLSLTEMADIFAKEPKFTKFDKQEFLKLASPFEGYLFPDTYLFLPNITAEAVIDAMKDNFERKVGSLQADMTVFGRPLTDVIKMASIVEVEARTTETRQIIAGILWKRLDQGMPLQVDAAFAFVNGKKDSKYISLADLAIDSPYNTYIHKGLPPTPISNPGLDSIKATLHPIPTKYYFYLSDKDGNMHYAVTLEEHEANKAKYLDY